MFVREKTTSSFPAGHFSLDVFVAKTKNEKFSFYSIRNFKHHEIQKIIPAVELPKRFLCREKLRLQCCFHNSSRRQRIFVCSYGKVDICNPLCFLLIKHYNFMAYQQGLPFLRYKDVFVSTYIFRI